MINLWKNYLEWRHSKGFGVHSPYAYRFVVDVLRPGQYGFYALEEIDNQLKGDEIHNHKLINLVKFTLRLSIFLKIKRIVAAKSDSRLVEIVTNSIGISRGLFNIHKEWEFKEGDLLVIYNSDFKEEVIHKAISGYIPIFAINPDIGIRNLLEKPLKKGLLLDGKRKMVLIPRKEMDYVSYDINLDLKRQA